MHTQQTNETSFDLPEDIWMYLFSFLKLPHVFALGSISRSLKNLSVQYLINRNDQEAIRHQTQLIEFLLSCPEEGMLLHFLPSMLTGLWKNIKHVPSDAIAVWLRFFSKLLKIPAPPSIASLTQCALDKLSDTSFLPQTFMFQFEEILRKNKSESWSVLIEHAGQAFQYSLGTFGWRLCMKNDGQIFYGDKHAFKLIGAMRCSVKDTELSEIAQVIAQKFASEQIVHAIALLHIFSRQFKKKHVILFIGDVVDWLSEQWKGMQDIVGLDSINKIKLPQPQKMVNELQAKNRTRIEFITLVISELMNFSAAIPVSEAIRLSVLSSRIFFSRIIKILNEKSFDEQYLFMYQACEYFFYKLKEKADIESAARYFMQMNFQPNHFSVRHNALKQKFNHFVLSRLPQDSDLITYFQTGDISVSQHEEISAEKDLVKRCLVEIENRRLVQDSNDLAGIANAFITLYQTQGDLSSEQCKSFVKQVASRDFLLRRIAVLTLDTSLHEMMLCIVQKASLVMTDIELLELKNNIFKGFQLLTERNLSNRVLSLIFQVEAIGKQLTVAELKTIAQCILFEVDLQGNQCIRFYNGFSVLESYYPCMLKWIPENDERRDFKNYVFDKMHEAFSVSLSDDEMVVALEGDNTFRELLFLFRMAEDCSKVKNLIFKMGNKNDDNEYDDNGQDIYGLVDHLLQFLCQGFIHHKDIHQFIGLLKFSDSLNTREGTHPTLIEEVKSIAEWFDTIDCAVKKLADNKKCEEKNSAPQGFYQRDNVKKNSISQNGINLSC